MKKIKIYFNNLLALLKARALYRSLSRAGAPEIIAQAAAAALYQTLKK